MPVLVAIKMGLRIASTLPLRIPWRKVYGIPYTVYLISSNTRNMRDMPLAKSKYFCTLMRFAASPCPTLPRLWRVHGFAWTCGTMAEGTSPSTFSCLVIQIKWPESGLRQFVYHVYTHTPRLPMLLVGEGSFNSCHGALASAVGWYDQSKNTKTCNTT